jgi:ABC-2 type transport system ATP-binding protein
MGQRSRSILTTAAGSIEGRSVAVIELTGVSKVYGDVVALDGVDLEVGTGEVVGLLGPNGAGKSTLFELTLGLAVPSAGMVRVLGQRPGGAVRVRVGAMLQNAGLPEQITVGELVGLVGRSYPTAVQTELLLEQVGLTDRSGCELATLSGGERQRLLLAVALVGDPDVLLLDEPTAAMDVEARRRFWDHVRGATGRGTTVLFATHDLAEADAVADRVVLLDRGRIVADAEPSELKRLVPGCVVTLTSDAAPELIAALPEVRSVALLDGGPNPEGARRFAVSATGAAEVVVPLVRAGYDLFDLAVEEADLQTAFARLTGLDRDPDATDDHTETGASW